MKNSKGHHHQGQNTLPIHELIDPEIQRNFAAISQEHSPSSYSSTSSPDRSTKEQPLKLLTAAFDGNVYALRIVVDGSFFPSPPGYAPQESFIGHDGNKSYCQVCKEFGEIVCCDGCPRAFHPDCLPTNGESHSSLLRDDDPWFCPVCYVSRGQRETGSNITSAVDEHTSESSVGKSDPVPPGQLEQVEVLADTYDDEVHRANKGESSDSSSDIEVPPDAGQDAASNSRKRRRSPSLHQVEATPSTKDIENQKKKAKPRKRSEIKESKKRRSRADSISERLQRRSRENPAESSPSKHHNSYSDGVPSDPLAAALGNRSPAQGLVQATPAFYYFLGESRWKIERSLSKSHRYFNRLSKGNPERNALVAKEAAIWWTKLRPSEYQRYVNMSIQDFEQRVIEWKEDKNVLEMGVDELGDWANESQSLSDTSDDDELRRALHKRLYESISTGVKPTDQSSGEGYKTLFQALLLDLRYSSSIPMFCVSRSGGQDVVTDPKLTNRVHGPISTSIGDECLGCARGWAHFCSVVQRRLPAVRRRAKVQTGLSSFMATRVGLGLTPQRKREDSHYWHPEYSDEVTMEWKRSTQQEEIDDLDMLQTGTLTNATERADDTTLFIEHALALSRSKEINDDAGDLDVTVNEGLFKCSRCRRLFSEGGACVFCLRSQLTTSTLKGRSSDSGKKATVQNVIMPRLFNSEKMAELSQRDRLLAKKLLRPNWLPTIVLPPLPAHLPRRHTDIAVEAMHVSNEEREDEQEEMEPDQDYQSDESEMGQRDVGLEGEEQLAVSKNDPGEDMLVNSEEVRRTTLFVASAGMFLAVLRRIANGLFNKHCPREDKALERESNAETMRVRILGNEYDDIESIMKDLRAVCEIGCSGHSVNEKEKQASDITSEFLSAIEAQAHKWILECGQFHNLCERNPADSGIIDTNEKSHKPSKCSCFSEQLTLATLRETESWFRQLIVSNTLRTRENEVAYYGAMALARALTAANASLAPYPNSIGRFSAIPMRSSHDDEELRYIVDQKVAAFHERTHQLGVRSYQEELAVQMLRSVKTHRVQARRSRIDKGCSRCNSLRDQWELCRIVGTQEIFNQSSESCKERIDSSRLSLSSGIGSDLRCRQMIASKYDDKASDSTEYAFVSAGKSNIHGIGVFADKDFEAGETILSFTIAVDGGLVQGWKSSNFANANRHLSVRLGDKKLLADRSGLARFINHSCMANSLMKIDCEEKDEPSVSSKRVLLVAKFPIAMRDEITVDYQMPLEHDLTQRIPCRCSSDLCHGFMNWHCPEIGMRSQGDMK